MTPLKWYANLLDCSFILITRSSCFCQLEKQERATKDEIKSAAEKQEKRAGGLENDLSSLKGDVKGLKGHSRALAEGVSYLENSGEKGVPL